MTATGTAAPTASDKGLLDPRTADLVQLRRDRPSAALAEVVERYWSITWSVPSRQVQPVLPHPCVNVAFGTQDPGVHGPLRHRDDHAIDGSGWVFGVKLRPGALVALGLGHGRRLVDARLTVPQVFGPAGTRAVAEMTDASPEDRPAVIERLLLPRLPVRDSVWAEFSAVIAEVLGNRELVRVAQVADATGWSIRTLQRWFRHYIGLSPAQVLARYRLQDAAEALADPGAVVADLADRLGYCDQAHFTNAFTAAVGMPPAAYARWCRDPS